MKRKDEIQKAAMQVAGVHPDWSNLDCFRMGFREGAKFADNTMLDRACWWLKENIDLYAYESSNTHYPKIKLTECFEEAFRQAMEGE